MKHKNVVLTKEAAQWYLDNVDIYFRCNEIVIGPETHEQDPHVYVALLAAMGECPALTVADHIIDGVVLTCKTPFGEASFSVDSSFYEVTNETK